MDLVRAEIMACTSNTSGDDFRHLDSSLTNLKYYLEKDQFRTCLFKTAAAAYADSSAN
jgi:hypothetical protein